jgi:hypothetical protein
LGAFRTASPFPLPEFHLSYMLLLFVIAGIIGLLTAEALLAQKLSVALVERKQLFAGATGAGQVSA